MTLQHILPFDQVDGLCEMGVKSGSQGRLTVPLLGRIQ